MVNGQLQTNVNQARQDLQRRTEESRRNSQQINILNRELVSRRRRDPTFFGSRFRASSLNKRIQTELRIQRNIKSSIGTSQARLQQAKRLQDIAQGRVTRKQQLAISLAKRKARVKVKAPKVRRAKIKVSGKQKFQVKIGKITFTGSKSFIDRQIQRDLKKRQTKIEGKPLQIKSEFIRKKTLAELIPGITLKQGKISSEAFTKKELTMIQQAKDPKQAVKVIEELRKRQEVASRQKIQTFLRLSLGDVTTKKQVDNLNKSINKEIKKREDKGFKRDQAVNQVLAEVKLIKSNLRKGKLSLKGIKTFGVNAVNGFIGVFTAPVVGSYNYGRALVKKGLWSKGKDNPLLKDVSNIIVKGSVNTARATKFVITNPTETQILVGVAAALLGVSLLGGLRKSPGKTLGEATAILFPVAVVKGVVKVGKVSLKGLKAGSVAYEKAVLKVFEADARKIKSTTIKKVNAILDSSVSVSKKKEALYRILSSQAINAIPLKEFKRLNFSKLKQLYKNSPNVIKALEKIQKAKVPKKVKKPSVKKIKKKVITKIKKIIFVVGGKPKLSPKLVKAKKKADKVFRRQVKQAETQARKGFKVGAFKGSKKAQVKSLSREVQQVQDKAQQTMKKGLVLGKGDTIRFQIGLVTPVTVQAQRTFLA